MRIDRLKKIILKNDVIRVIKRKDVAEKLKTALKATDGPANSNHETAHVVNSWIFEHKEKLVKEKAFSDDKILSWDLLPKTIE